MEYTQEHVGQQRGGSPRPTTAATAGAAASQELAGILDDFCAALEILEK